VQTVVAAWASEGDTFSWQTENLTFPGRPAHHGTRAIVPKPWQKPHPPVWAAAVTERSSRVVGEAGLGLLSFSILQSVEAMAEQIRIYREAQANAAPMTQVTTNRVAAYTLVHCAETMAQAEANGVWDSVWWWYQNYAELALEWDFRELDQEAKDAIFPLLRKHADGDFEVRDFNDADMIIVGDVEQCVEKMMGYAEAGVDQLICYSAFGGMPHDAVMRSIELLGTEVMPELERRGIEARATLRPRKKVEAVHTTASNASLTPGGISR
jgi:alkanesulfonate monooxygenase SsuD/methylene tetrahydromethanopterin reductase-like flavin-dependent oxidoreductase (luciferase family)